MLSTVVGFFNNVVLYPVKKANLTFRYKLEAFEKYLREKTKHIPNENLQVPPVMIAGPTLEALRYTYDEAELREMYENLLASAMDTTKVSKVHPSFVDTIKQMSPLKASGVKYRAEFASFNAYFLDSIKGIRDIVLNNAEKERENEVNRRSDELLAETKKMKDQTTKTAAANELLVTLFIIVTLAVGVVLVCAGKLSVGMMIVGITAVFGSFGPVIALASLPSNLTQTFAAGDRVLNLLEEQPAVKEVKTGEKIDYENLEVKDLSFAYEKNVPVLKNICMYAQKGEVIGIVGESGCGKSTFLKMLLRFWEKDNGVIAYNGIDIDNIVTSNLLDNVTLVSQSTYLFDETIEDNLRIAKPNATQKELEEACKLASVHDFIMKLSDGYKTRVGAMGDNLSAGEKQRIGLARAFLKGSELILLDEPTSNVDAINEGMILKSLAEQKSKKSIILVSHRESTMAIADRIYKVDNGQMTEVANA